MNQENENLDISPTQVDYRKAMSENLHGRDINNVRVLSYQNKAPAPPEVKIKRLQDFLYELHYTRIKLVSGLHKCFESSL